MTRVLCVMAVMLALTLTVRVQAASDRVVYGDALGSGVQDWSWNTTVNAANASPVQAGSASLAATFQQAWAGLFLHLEPAQSTAGYDRIRFHVRGSSAATQLRFVVDGTQAGGTLAANAGAWTLVEVSLASLGSPATITDLQWQDATGAAQPTFYLDNIVLAASTGPVPPTATPSAGPSLSVNVGADRAAISPWVYGLNYPDPALAQELALPLARWGGNSTSRYNWRLDVYNTGSDYYFQNITNPVADAAALPAGSAADRFVIANQAAGSDSLITLPMLGWVAKRRVDQHPYDCGFSVARYGAQAATDPWDPDCGNGSTPGNGLITGNDPADTSIRSTTTLVRDWVAHLRTTFGAANAGGVRFYNLDNEPMLWHETHRDVHPTPATYDEVTGLGIDYATVIKQADPAARTLGPVLWGWCAYFYSARDTCAPGADYASHGNSFFVPWYLTQMRQAEQTSGTRLLDYLDLHYYPQGAGVALGSAGNAATQALRLRSTRSLWDPAYVDESWIGGMGLDGGVVRLIPRMRAWVNTHYPGTGLAISEYNWGGLESMNGALAQADVLGIFGREGLDIATLWSPPTPTQPGAFAFRMYLNYDGAGAAFGDTRVRAVSSNSDQLAIYAAQRSGDRAVTLMVLNKTGGSLSTTLSLSGYLPAPTARVFRYSGADLTRIVRQPDLPVSASAVSITVPANSITLIELRSDAPPNLPRRLHLALLAR